jgi:solute carrier family 35 (UDP-galactose transporter), member B1
MSNTMKKRGSSVSLSTYNTCTTTATATTLSLSSRRSSADLTEVVLEEHTAYDDIFCDEEVGRSTSSMSSSSDGSGGTLMMHEPLSPSNDNHAVAFLPHQRRRNTMLSSSPPISSACLVQLDTDAYKSNDGLNLLPPLDTKKSDDHQQEPEIYNNNSDHSIKPSDLLGFASTAAATTTTSSAHTGSTSSGPQPSSNSSSSATATNSTGSSSSSSNTPVWRTKPFQLVVGATGIYSAYLYYGLVQEDLFRYRNSVTGQGFTHVWALQVLESTVTMVIGYLGRKFSGGRDGLPLAPFFQSGASQLAAKALMSLSLSAGLSFPVVTLAKSAKIVPVMLGQLFMGGSSYAMRDYLFAVLIVVGTALLSAGGKTADDDHELAQSRNTLSGLVLIFASLTADGFTGGLQKKLKRVTASLAPTTYDFLYYSHMAQLLVAVVICVVTRELWAAPLYLVQNPVVWWPVLASCICSAVGQCFIFYVISCFDPLICTTITTTRKVLTVVLSISFKGHDLTGTGCLGLGLAFTALMVEVEGQVTAYRKRKLKQKGAVKSTSPSPAPTTLNGTALTLPLLSSN